MCKAPAAEVGEYRGRFMVVWDDCPQVIMHDTTIMTCRD